MNDSARQKIQAILEDRKRATGYFMNNSETYRMFEALEEKALRSGALEKKVKELMALAISIVVKCEPCIEWHVKEAMKAGASDNQILEAMEVAFALGGGPATVQARLALNVMEYYKEKGLTAA
jgi:AhpD family alkylhydroperoxidase